MKLISVMSRGDRLVKIYEEENLFTTAGLEIISGVHRHRHTAVTITRPGAFEAAEEWLKEAVEKLPSKEECERGKTDER